MDPLGIQQPRSGHYRQESGASNEGPPVPPSPRVVATPGMFQIPDPCYGLSGENFPGSCRGPLRTGSADYVDPSLIGLPNGNGSTQPLEQNDLYGVDGSHIQLPFGNRHHLRDPTPSGPFLIPHEPLYVYLSTVFLKLRW